MRCKSTSATKTTATWSTPWASKSVHYVDAVFLVFGTHCLQHIAVGNQVEREFHCERPRVVLRIVDSQVDVHMPEVAAMVALDHAGRFAAGVSRGVEWSLSVKARGLDGQCVALPLAHGISHPGELQILGKPSTVCVDLARRIVVLEQHYHLLLRLDNLERQDQGSQRDAIRKTARTWQTQAGGRGL